MQVKNDTNQLWNPVYPYSNSVWSGPDELAAGATWTGQSQYDGTVSKWNDVKVGYKLSLYQWRNQLVSLSVQNKLNSSPVISVCTLTTQEQEIYCDTAYPEESRSLYARTSVNGEKLLTVGFSSTLSSDWRVVTLTVTCPDGGTCPAWTIS